MKASNRKPLEIGYEIETIPYSNNNARPGTVTQGAAACEVLD